MRKDRAVTPASSMAGVNSKPLISNSTPSSPAQQAVSLNQAPKVLNSNNREVSAPIPAPRRPLSRSDVPGARALVTLGNTARDQSGAIPVLIMDIFHLLAFLRVTSAFTGPFPNRKVGGHGLLP